MTAETVAGCPTSYKGKQGNRENEHLLPEPLRPAIVPSLRPPPDPPPLGPPLPLLLPPPNHPPPPPPSRLPPFPLDPEENDPAEAVVP